MYCMGFIVLLVFAYVLYGLYRFVDILLCIAWVLSLCWYLMVYCTDFIVLLVLEYVLHRFWRVVGI